MTILDDLFDNAELMKNGYGFKVGFARDRVDYAPVYSLTQKIQADCYGKLMPHRPGLFTPVRSLSEARRVIVSPLHIAIHGISYNARSVLEAVAGFLRNELDAITNLSPVDVIVRARDAVYFAIQIAVSVLQAVIDTLISALTIVTRAAATVTLGVVAMGNGLYSLLPSCNTAKNEKPPVRSDEDSQHPTTGLTPIS